MKCLCNLIPVLCVVIINSKRGRSAISRRLRGKYEKEGRTKEVGETVDERSQSAVMVMLYVLFLTCTVFMQVAHRFTTLLAGIDYLIITRFRRARIVAKSAC